MILDLNEIKGILKLLTTAASFMCKVLFVTDDHDKATFIYLIYTIKF